jgi:hypothetical protein
MKSVQEKMQTTTFDHICKIPLRRVEGGRVENLFDYGNY